MQARTSGWSIATRLAKRIPLVGFYLQPAVGGVLLGPTFWRRLAALDNVVAIKIAPFNRYRTLDVVRGVVEAGAEDRVTLYTGNDDHILPRPGHAVPAYARRQGGHVAHQGRAARPLERPGQAGRGAARPHARGGGRQARSTRIFLRSMPRSPIATPRSSTSPTIFKGCIAGCHEVLRRQGLLRGIWCLDPEEGLSPGQAAEIDRVSAAYPELTDDDYVSANLARWLA